MTRNWVLMGNLNHEARSGKRLSSPLDLSRKFGGGSCREIAKGCPREEDE